MDAPAAAAAAAPPPAPDENIDTHHHHQQQQQQPAPPPPSADKPPAAAVAPPPIASPAPPAPLDDAPDNNTTTPMSLDPDEPITPAWAMRLERVLDAATRATTTSDEANDTSTAPAALRRALPARVLAELVSRATKLLQAEPTLVELQPQPGEHVVVVGDTHGQFHDLRRLFATAGYPCEEEQAEDGATPPPSSSSLPPVLIDPRALCANLLQAATDPTPTTTTPMTRRTYVFNGDYVDRGAWGVELLALVLAWKLALPERVVMLRGNHESATCTRVYGFFAELAAKYGAAGGGGALAAAAPVPLSQRRQQQQQPQQPQQRPPPSHKKLYLDFRRLFATMPLASLIAGRTLVLHGGLFRAPATAAPVGKKGGKKGGGKKAAAAARPPPPPHAGPLRVGTLAQLRAAPKGGQDPDGFTAASRVSADVLWSDPVLQKGLRPNVSRGVGCVFGPDVTDAFLRAEGLELVLRSHEGPDARDRFSDDEEDGEEGQEEQEEEQRPAPRSPPASDEDAAGADDGEDEDPNADPTRRDYGDGMRAELGPMLEGYSVDHVTPHGVLMTVFSAPDYPQFQPEHDDDGEEEDKGEGEEGRAKAEAAEATTAAPPTTTTAAAGDDVKADAGDAEMPPAPEDADAKDLPSPPKRKRGRYNNLASVALLIAPTWAAPTMLRFAADLPRPPAPPYYDFELCMAPSDEGEELAAALGPAISSGADDAEEEEAGGGGAKATTTSRAAKRQRRRGAAAGVAAAVAAEAAGGGGSSDDSDFDPSCAEGGGRGASSKKRARSSKRGKASSPPPPAAAARRTVATKSKAAAAAGVVGSPTAAAHHVVEVAAAAAPAAAAVADDGPKEEEQQAVPVPPPVPPAPQVAAAATANGGE
jgi:serine/threonine-protein phosphatase 5